MKKNNIGCSVEVLHTMREPFLTVDQRTLEVLVVNHASSMPSHHSHLNWFFFCLFVCFCVCHWKKHLTFIRPMHILFSLSVVQFQHRCPMHSAISMKYAWLYETMNSRSWNWKCWSPHNFTNRLLLDWNWEQNLSVLLLGCFSWSSWMPFYNRICIFRQNFITPDLLRFIYLAISETLTFWAFKCKI